MLSISTRYLASKSGLKLTEFTKFNQIYLVIQMNETVFSLLLFTKKKLSSFSGRPLNNFQVTPTKKERKWIQPILNTFLLPIVITLARTHVPILPRMFLTLPIAWHPEYFNLCANMYTNNGTKMFDKVCSYYLGQSIWWNF